MSNLQIIEMLCGLVEEQSKVIRHLSIELSNARDLSDAEMQMVQSTRQKYSDILGADEVPDNL